ncbi:MAG: glycosyltransferase, partial [Muribaculaceae bacterium]|nr:glycosyltransferase [Muribaculaceae bacterium]
MYFSVIVPVYNRRGEVRDLLESLSRQTARELFEVLIVEDGSSEPCRDIVQEYND